MTADDTSTNPITDLTHAVRELTLALRDSLSAKSRKKAAKGGFSPAELGRRLGKSTRTITRRIEEGLIAAKPFGRSWVIDRAEVERIDRDGVGRSRRRTKVKAMVLDRRCVDEDGKGAPHA